MPTTPTTVIDPAAIAAALTDVHDDKTFLHRLLAETLNWPVPEDESLSFADLTYDWTAGARRAPGIDAKLLDGRFAELNLTGPGQTWGVFILTFNDKRVFDADRGMTGVLREVLNGLRPSSRRDPALRSWPADHLLFICTHDWTQYRFAHFQPKPAGGPPKLAAFGWHAGSPAVRTACEFNLSHLGWPRDDGHDPAAWVAGWSEAFSVERVTKRFYREYADEFDRLRNRVTPLAGEDQKMFTQALLNRLMFLRFIERKKWLTPPGHAEPSPDYLRDLFAAGGHGKQSFYAGRLCPLFFDGLAKDGHQELPAIGKVPFLNGGLFERSKLDEKVPDLPDDALAPRLGPGGLFYRYNFTVQESTPLNVEVAVDPEMLGKVFEELVTGRHESGSYYTPRPIVSFMCREALKGYLADAAAVPEATVAAFVDHHQTDGIDIPAAGRLAAALDRCRAVDPACGSGAYLLGLLHEMVDLYTLLYSGKLKADDTALHELKLRIISHSLYGVDLDPFATNIAMLRLWLSLSVDSAVPLPLPNLDFKIETGDSLTGPDPSRDADSDAENAIWQMRRWKAARELVDKKAAYLDCHDDTKTAKRLEIYLKQKTLAIDLEAALGPGVIDWRVHFAEVFAPRPPDATATGHFAFTNDLPNAQRAFTVPADNTGGFDIVLANPPYVRQELIRDQKPRLKAVFGPLFSGTADLYIFFYFRGLQLLKPGGMLAYISPNKWFRAVYGQKLRAHIAATTSVRTILDFHDLPVFESAIAYPMIFVAGKKATADSPAAVLVEPPNLEAPYPDVKAVVAKYGNPLPPTALGADGTWHLAVSTAADRLAKMRAAGPALGEYVGGRIYYGLKTGLNEAWIDDAGHVYVKGDTRPKNAVKRGVLIIDDSERNKIIAMDANSRRIIQPLTLGRNIKKWLAESSGKWLINTAWNLDIEAYPAVLEHLKPFRKVLEARPECRNGVYDWWCLARYGAEYAHEFSNPKIVYQEIATYQSFALDSRGTYLNNKCFMVCSDDAYLLAVLNSQPAWSFLGELAAKMVGGAYAMQAPHVQQIPIPSATAGDRATIAALAQKCLEAKGVGCEAWEAEINERVAALYGL